jgi:hypothetical protein
LSVTFIRSACFPSRLRRRKTFTGAAGIIGIVIAGGDTATVIAVGGKSKKCGALCAALSFMRRKAAALAPY